MAPLRGYRIRINNGNDRLESLKNQVSNQICLQSWLKGLQKRIFGKIHYGHSGSGTRRILPPLIYFFSCDRYQLADPLASFGSDVVNIDRQFQWPGAKVFHKRTIAHHKYNQKSQFDVG